MIVRKSLWLVGFYTLLLNAWRSQAFDANTPRHLQLAFNEYEFEVMNLLGLAYGTQSNQSKRHLPLGTSASNYLMDVYEELRENEDDNLLGSKSKRTKRGLESKSRYPEIENCNNIITFSSITRTLSSTKLMKEATLKFNFNGVPGDAQLVNAVLRIYQKPASNSKLSNESIVISVLQRYFTNNNKSPKSKKRMVTAINSTLGYNGWHQFNVTHLVSGWLNPNAFLDKELVVCVIYQMSFRRVNIRNVGLVTSDTMGSAALQPFIIGCFHGPELLRKFQNLEMRFKRQTIARRREYYMPPPTLIYKQPKNCERLNFTLDFRDLHMHDWVIAPKKFEAYFCGGECNFPLASRMNATNHAIVQTLMHLKEPSIPKPCCVPTALGSISILHYLNEDSVNLNRYPQSVAKQCGCH